MNAYMTLKITLPPTEIVRTVVVPSKMTLVDLHEMVQMLMGWEDEHLWHFTDGKRDGVIYELPHEDDFGGFMRRLKLDAGKTTVAKAFPKRGAKLVYEYDFGDSWDHTITRMADPKKPELACTVSKGPEGLEDFGGQWRFAEFLASLREDPTSDDWAEDREWAGIESPEEIEAYLAGRSAEDYTRDLKERFGNLDAIDVSQSESGAKAVEPMSDEEQAHTLGLMFAVCVSEDMWDILERALKAGGSCQFEDPDKDIGQYFLTMFDGLKVKDGRTTPFATNPSTLTVHKVWVDWYAAHAEEWRTMRIPFDILEAYACSAVNLYGVISTVDYYELVLRYDPGLQLSYDEVVRQLEARQLCPRMPYRIEGDLLVNDTAYPEEREDADEVIKAIRRAQASIPRWYPATRDELFQWEYPEIHVRTPEVDGVELILRSICKIDDEDMEEVLEGIQGLNEGNVPAEAVYRGMVMMNLCPKLSQKARRPLIEAIERWADVTHSHFLNGNTSRDLRAQEASKPKIARNAPCPCGSGKKYKMCCGKNA